MMGNIPHYLDQVLCDSLDVGFLVLEQSGNYKKNKLNKNEGLGKSNETPGTDYLVYQAS